MLKIEGSSLILPLTIYVRNSFKKLCFHFLKTGVRKPTLPSRATVKIKTEYT